MTEDTYEARVQADTPATTVIRQHPLSDAIGRYEAWLKEIVPVAQTFAGHQSVSVIRPHVASDAYTIVLHFELRRQFAQMAGFGNARARHGENPPVLARSGSDRDAGRQRGGPSFPDIRLPRSQRLMRCGRN